MALKGQDYGGIDGAVEAETERILRKREAK
jgi:hypothetical protein